MPLVLNAQRLFNTLGLPLSKPFTKSYRVTLFTHINDLKQIKTEASCHADRKCNKANVICVVLDG